MGGEFGQFIEWDYKKALIGICWTMKCIKNFKKYIKDLNTLYKNEKAFYEVDFSSEVLND